MFGFGIVSRNELFRGGREFRRTSGGGSFRYRWFGVVSVLFWLVSVFRMGLRSGGLVGFCWSYREVLVGISFRISLDVGCRDVFSYFLF